MVMKNLEHDVLSVMMKNWRNSEFSGGDWGAISVGLVTVWLEISDSATCAESFSGTGAPEVCEGGACGGVGATSSGRGESFLGLYVRTIGL